MVQVVFEIEENEQGLVMKKAAVVAEDYSPCSRLISALPETC